MEHKVSIREASFEDLSAIRLPEWMASTDPETQLPRGEWLGVHARTILHRGTPLAVFGVLPLWKGVGHLFGYVDERAPRYPITLTAGAMQLLQLACRNFEFWRLQATVPATFNRGIAFLSHLGFAVDGFLPRYGPDAADHVMMSRIS